MGLAVLVVLVVVVALVAAAATLAIRSRREYLAGNEVIPGRPSAAPEEWAGAHTVEARLHRRLVDVVAALRAQPLLEEGTGRLEARVELEERAADIDERLIAAAALPDRVRDEPLGRLGEEVAAIEQAAADLTVGAIGATPATGALPAPTGASPAPAPAPAPTPPQESASETGGSPEALAVGAEFAGYRILDVIGSGGFATVYLGEDVRPEIQRKVAVKVLRADISADPAHRDRFRRESLLAVQLEHHPNIVPIYDAGEADGHLYIAMRHIDGTDLKEKLKDGPLTPDDAVSVVTQVAGALDVAHATGLVHRDVKPGNVLLPGGTTDRVYLADFGLTKETDADQSLTQIGQFLGTLYYAAPEQIQGKDLDGRSDQYALGCLLYECLTGEPPFKGEVQAIIGAHLTEPAPAATAAVPTLPSAIDAVIVRAMAKDPADRYASCGELAAEAAGALSEPAEETTASDPTAASSPTPAPAADPAPSADSAPTPDPGATVVAATPDPAPPADPGATVVVATPESTATRDAPPTDPGATVVVDAPDPAPAADPNATVLGGAGGTPLTSPPTEGPTMAADD
ncbi:MAG TPA: serine/threonine-protein kinase [Acidimicrobiales bacterium]|nr:serine/threonine-protein kinase [Acidimicrobiales bacterium]